MANTLTWKENKIITNADIEPATNTIIFCPTFNQLISEYTFNNISLTSIYFGTRFNQNLAPFPPNIKKIVFGKNFNKPISENTFPQTLETLIFGENFCQVLDKGCLPSSLKRLHIEYLTNDINNHYLPNLRFYSGSLLYKIPDNVEKVRHIIHITDYSIPIQYPKNIKSITIESISGTLYNKVPDIVLPSISSLKIKACINHNIAKSIVFPDSIKQIEIRCFVGFNALSRDKLPNNEITIIVPSQYMNHYNNLCDKIIDTKDGKTTFLLDNTNKFIGIPKDTYGTNVFCWSSVATLDQAKISPEVNTLVFGPIFNKIIYQSIIPANIKKIVFNDSYNIYINHNVLPPMLETLILGISYPHIINKGILPPSLKRLHVGILLNSIDDHDLPNLRFFSISYSYCDHKVPDTVEKVRHSVGLAGHGVTKFNYPSGIKSISINNIYRNATCSTNNNLQKYTLPFITNLKIKNCNDPTLLNYIAFPDSIKQIEFISMTNKDQIKNIRRDIFPNTTIKIIIPNDGTHYYSHLNDETLANNNGKYMFLLKNYANTLNLNSNVPITNILPTIETIIFGPRFNQNLVPFPNHIKKIVFGNDFNKSIENVLPNMLETLILGDNFYQVIVTLPQSLKRLHIVTLRQHLDCLNLPNLRFLSIPYCIYRIPETVEKVRHNIILSVHYIAPFIYPKNIKTLTISNIGIDHTSINTSLFKKYTLPSITNLKIKNCGNPDLINYLVFPDSIKHIEFIKVNFRDEIKNIRKNIFPNKKIYITVPATDKDYYLHLCDEYRYTRDGKSMFILNNTNLLTPIIKQAPITTLNWIENIPITNISPAIETIIFGSTFNQQPLVQLPNHIKKIVFGNDFNKFIRPLLLPNKLEALFLGNNFNQVFYKNALPQTLKRLHVGILRNSIDDHDLPNLKFFSISYSYCYYKIVNNVEKVRHKIGFAEHGVSKFNYPLSIKSISINNIYRDGKCSDDTILQKYILPPITNLKIKNCDDPNLINYLVFPDSIKQIEFMNIGNKDRIKNIRKNIFPNTEIKIIVPNEDHGYYSHLRYTAPYTSIGDKFIFIITGGKLEEKLTTDVIGKELNILEQDPINNIIKEEPITIEQEPITDIIEELNILEQEPIINIIKEDPFILKQIEHLINIVTKQETILNTIANQTELISNAMKQDPVAIIKEPETIHNYIYLLREREFIKTNENIYKIGRTNQCFMARFKQYPKGSKLELILAVTDSITVENILKKALTAKFTKRTDIGSEYFQGSLKEIKKVVTIICQDYY